MDVAERAAGDGAAEMMAEPPREDDPQSRLSRALLIFVMGTFFAKQFTGMVIQDFQTSVLAAVVLAGFATAVFWSSDDEDGSRKKKGGARPKGASSRDASAGKGAESAAEKRRERVRRRRAFQDDPMRALRDAQEFTARAAHAPLSVMSQIGIGALFVAVALVSFYFFTVGDVATIPLGLGFGGIVGCIVALVVQSRRSFPRRKTSVVVGVDGVRVGKTYVPYAEIEEVFFEVAQDTESYVKTLVLRRRGRAPLRVASLYFPLLAVTAADNVRQVPLVAAIEEGLSAWRSRQDSPELTAEELLSRGRSAPGEWLIRLRALGTGATATYREAALSREALTRLLTSPAARPSTRAAAAIALRASEESLSDKRLRIGSAGFVDAKLRVAAGDLESAADDEALLEALESLEAAERRAWAPETR